MKGSFFEKNFHSKSPPRDEHDMELQDVQPRLYDEKIFPNKSSFNR